MVFTLTIYRVYWRGTTEVRPTVGKWVAGQAVTKFVHCGTDTLEHAKNRGSRTGSGGKENEAVPFNVQLLRAVRRKKEGEPMDRAETYSSFTVALTSLYKDSVTAKPSVLEEPWPLPGIATPALEGKHTHLEWFPHNASLLGW